MTKFGLISASPRRKTPLDTDLPCDRGYTFRMQKSSANMRKYGQMLRMFIDMYKNICVNLAC